MTNNNEEPRPRRIYNSANNERHVSSNRQNYNDRRTQNDGSDDSYSSRERGFRPSPNEYRPRYSGVNNENEEGAKKRRPRVGERINQPAGRDYANNNNQNRYSGNGGYRNQSTQGQYKSQGNIPLKKKKKPFKQVKYKENADPNAPIRLNKYLANAGVCSRREADEFIQAGVVKVNGQVVTELGTKITRSDEVMFHDQPVKLESKVYVLLNKPKGFVTTTDDPENRKTVMELVKSVCSERIYPVGRLDRSTTGVLLLTNDGDLASKLTHPKYEKRKIYQVWLDKPVSMEHMQAIADGIELEDGEIHADAISYVSEEDLSQVGIEIHSGKNRVVRRIFEKLGYHVLKLDRVYFAGLTKKNLARGKWRYLTEKEVNMLRMGIFD